MAEARVTYTRSRRVVVDTVPTLILEHNSKRVSLIIVNHSGFEGRVAPVSEADTDLGLPVAAQGGSLSLCYAEDRDMVKRPFYAVCIGGSGTWFVMEEVEA